MPHSVRFHQLEEELAVLTVAISLGLKTLVGTEVNGLRGQCPQGSHENRPNVVSAKAAK